MISLQTIAFILFATGAFGWIRALIIERNKWREAFFTEHRMRVDAEIEGGLVYEKPKRKNDEYIDTSSAHKRIPIDEADAYLWARLQAEIKMQEQKDREQESRENAKRWTEAARDREIEAARDMHDKALKLAKEQQERELESYRNYREALTRIGTVPDERPIPFPANKSRR